MRSPKSMSIIIACPHCGTRYQVPPETLGDAGRKVACAHCGKSWLAEPEATLPRRHDDDRLFSAADEAELDRNFSAAEAALRDVPAAVRQLIPKGEVPPPEVMQSIAQIKAALERRPETVPADPSRLAGPSKEQRQAEGRLARRHRSLAEALPAARFNRVWRGAGIGLLVGLIGCGLLFRTEIVRLLPDLAGFYTAIGLKVNIVGLDFADVTTLVSRRGDTSVMSVHATIVGVEPRSLVVPPVVVTLLNDDGAPLYAWSVAPKVRDLEPGEVIGFSTELASPPEGVRQVRLSFADSTGALVPSISTDAEPAPASTDTHEEGSH